MFRCIEKLNNQYRFVLMITILFKMSKDKENIHDLSSKNCFEQVDNIEVVPYLNNNGDSLQDILDIVEDNTNDLQKQLISNNNENVFEIEFNK